MQKGNGRSTMVTTPRNQFDHSQPSRDMTPGQQSQGVVGATEISQDQALFEADKRAVYKHPLFPLLALLFEKCEMATQSNESPHSDTFNMDIQAFVQHQERDRKPFLLNDPEVDGLMIKAIQVLRIHLLELEKVQELCKDFCNRYITCLKGKMQSENLLRSDYGYESGNSINSGSSPDPQISYPSHPPSHNIQVVSANAQVLAVQQQPATHIAYHMVQTAQGFVAQPIQIHNSNNNSNSSSNMSGSQPSINNSSGGSHNIAIHGSTPLSQIGSNTCPPPQDCSILQAPPTPSSISDDDDILGSKKKPKRGVLPKHATSIMRSWLFQHIVHPYPTEDEKRQIAAQTNLTLLQVNNWFINARRRILQPMLDASNPDNGPSHKAKKPKTQGSKPAVQRFWPDNLANLHDQNGDGQNGSTPNSDSNMITSTVLSSDESDEDSCSHDDVPDILEHSDSSSQQ